MNLDLMVFFQEGGVNIMNLDNKKSKRTHWVSLFVDRNTVVYFDSFGI